MRLLAVRWTIRSAGRPAALLALPLLILSLFVVAACGGGSEAQEPEYTGDRLGEEATTARLDSDDPLVQDAKMYAKDQGVHLEEAVRRLQLQESIGELGAALETNERDIFAGLWIEHEPEYRVVTAFTGDGDERIRPYVEGGPLEDVVEVREADVTLVELQGIGEEAVSVTRYLGVPADSYIDMMNNRLVLETAARDNPGQTRLNNEVLRAAGVSRPDKVEVIEVDELAQPM